jgi:hypothetical protein
VVGACDEVAATPRPTEGATRIVVVVGKGCISRQAPIGSVWFRNES